MGGACWLRSLMVALFLFIQSSVYAETVLYCQSELANGFINKGGRWQSSEFEPRRWTIKFSRDFNTLHGLDKEGSPAFVCKPSYRGRVEHTKNVLICESGYLNGDTFIYNKQNKRFLMISPSNGAYIGGNGRDSDTDNFYAGFCREF